MKVKLDENMPEAASEFLRAQGCDVETVYSEGLSGSPDLDVVAAATREARVLITFDKGIANTTDPAYVHHQGIVLLRLKHPSVQTILTLLQTHFPTLKDQALTDRIAVLSSTGIRIR